MTPASDRPRLFIQLEFSHALCIPPGRYPTAQGDVLMIDILQGEKVRWRRRSRIETATAPAERAVALACATVVCAQPPDDPPAHDRLARLRRDERERVALRAAALALLNRAIRAARAAIGDPYLIEVTATDARAVRIGIGHPADLHRGDWDAAFELHDPAPPRSPRSEQVRMEQEISEALQERLAPYEAEELALRSLLDLEHGRTFAAAAQARAAVELFRVELGEPAPAMSPTGSPPDAEQVETIARHVLETAAEHRAARLHELRAARPALDG